MGERAGSDAAVAQKERSDAGATAKALPTQPSRLQSKSGRLRAARSFELAARSQQTALQSPATGSATSGFAARAPFPLAFPSAPSGMNPFSATAGFSFRTTSR